MTPEIAVYLQVRANMMIFMFLAIGLDLLGGVIVAWANGDFRLEVVPAFLKSSTPYIWAWITAELLGFGVMYFNLEINDVVELLLEYSGEAVYGFVIFKYVSSIVQKIQNLGKFSPIVSEGLSRLGIPKDE